jgi:peptidoglycan hydrolase-like protein with peptidoglycan-binding domain
MACAGAAAVAGAAVLAPAGVAGAAVSPSARYLHLGSHGPAVTSLQKRLAALHYYPGRIDGKFGWSTMEAVWAFKEVQYGRRRPPRPNVVGPTLQRQLKHPRLYKAHKPHGAAWRVEVNKNLEVLVVYKHSKITLISHISSAAYNRPDGTGFVTPNGRYRALEYLPGAVPDSTYGGFMYNPVFFIGRSYAIHGMPNPTSTFSFDGVPLNPASHGCVRVPMSVSKIFHKFVRISPTRGTPIYVFGRND